MHSALQRLLILNYTCWLLSCALRICALTVVKPIFPLGCTCSVCGQHSAVVYHKQDLSISTVSFWQHRKDLSLICNSQGFAEWWQPTWAGHLCKAPAHFNCASSDPLSSSFLAHRLNFPLQSKCPPYITDRKPLGFWDKTRYLNIGVAFQMPKGSRDWKVYPGPNGDFRPLEIISWIPGSMSCRCQRSFWTPCFAGYSSFHLMTFPRRYWGPCERTSWFLPNLLQPRRSKGKEGKNGSTGNK